MVHLPLGSRRSSASNVTEDGAASSRGASPRQPEDEADRVSRRSPAASLLGKLWPWGGESSGCRGSGLFGSRNSQTGMSNPAIEREDLGIVAEGAQQGIVDVEVDGGTRDGGVYVKYQTHAVPASDDAHELEEDHEVHIGSRKSGMEAAAAAAVEQEAAEAAAETAAEQSAESQQEMAQRPPVPKMSICIMVAGTRGDVQPFIALGLGLKAYGHRVRLASHAVYRSFVTSFGLEFYPLGGDPKVLSDFIVENRGIVPKSIKSGLDNIEQVNFIIQTTFPACTEPDPEGDGQPFMAQAIIANPPVYGHLHVAEKLGIPCHIFFTMPYSPTRAFPSPLARFQGSAEPGIIIGLRNYLSYWAVEDYIYLGLRRPLKNFRKQLGLKPLRAVEGNNPSHLIDFHKVPFGYCWSPAVLPKPPDWGPHIDVCGYFVLREGQLTSYQPPEELVNFLAAGPPPVYIGFGSLLVDNPKGLTKMILSAAQRTGQRIILCSGWGGLGEGAELPPEQVLLIDAAPHDWLLPRCAACVHHGGAGTAAAGLMAGLPTTVVHFFGDQVSWGMAVYRKGVGPKPIAIDHLTEDKLVAALEFMAQPDVKVKADAIAAELAQEDGVAAGVDAFHRHLPIEALRGEKVVWKLADPPQRSAARKALAAASNVVIRQPTKAGWEGSKYVTMQGYHATAYFSKGLWSLVALKPSTKELSTAEDAVCGSDGQVLLDGSSSEDEAAPAGREASFSAGKASGVQAALCSAAGEDVSIVQASAPASAPAAAAAAPVAASAAVTQQPSTPAAPELARNSSLAQAAATVQAVTEFLHPPADTAAAAPADSGSNAEAGADEGDVDEEAAIQPAIVYRAVSQQLPEAVLTPKGSS